MHRQMDHVHHIPKYQYDAYFGSSSQHNSNNFTIHHHDLDSFHAMQGISPNPYILSFITLQSANPQSELAHIITLLINYTLNKYSIPRSAPQIHLFFVACVRKNKARIPFPFTYHNFTYRSHNVRPKNNPPSPNPSPRENALFENGTKNHFFGLQNFTLSHDHTLEPSITLLGSDLEVAVNDTI